MGQLITADVPQSGIAPLGYCHEDRPNGLSVLGKGVAHARRRAVADLTIEVPLAANDL